MSVPGLLSVPSLPSTFEAAPPPVALADFCRTLLRCNSDGVVILSAEGDVEFVGENGLAHMGARAATDVVGIPWVTLWPDAERQKAVDAVSCARLGQIARFQATRPASDGAPQWWEVAVSPLSNEAGSDLHPSLLCVARDITALKDAQTRTVQSQRLEALGQLTGGVAHDFNNLLTVIMGASETLADDLTEGSGDKDLALVSLRAAERGANLVRRLLSLSRQQALDPQPVDCGAAIRAVEELTEQVLPEGIALRAAVPRLPLQCSADGSELESALLNLCINARDAIADGGEIYLTADAVSLTGRGAEQMALTPGSYVVFTVRDTGVGMSPEVLRRAVEPFFTTKTDTGGTGLGLSSVYGFARQSGGHLAISSETNAGTTVRLYLPRTTTRPHLPVEQLAVSVAGRGRQVLLVEDDAMVRIQVTRLLTELGYRVRAVDDAPAALAAIEGGDEIDLLMTDLELPCGLSGQELIEQARLVRPDLRALLTSGYRNQAAASEAGHEATTEFLAKPFRRSQLAGAVAVAMGEIKSDTRRFTTSDADLKSSATAKPSEI